MKQIDTRTLQHHLGEYLNQVEQGVTLKIRRHHQSIARIVPWGDDKVAEPWPDMYARLKDVNPQGPPVYFS